MVTATGDADAATRINVFAGSVSGLPGTFSCTGPTTTCTAPTRETDGSVPDDSAMGTWTFDPTDRTGTIDVTDGDGYVQFGWWLNPKGRKVENGFDVDTFAGPRVTTQSPKICRLELSKVARPTQVGLPASGRLPAPPKISTDRRAFHRHRNPRGGFRC